MVILFCNGSTEARMLNAAANTPSVSLRNGDSIITEKLHFRSSIKHSGPSPSGPGHKFKNFRTIGRTKRSGPSPGVGH
ncbi:hypothetical protein CDL15_Pgr003365 [Punica granatum]|uniref:Uncharacterized protein n=1 Tax=Punica granatum TaxID=22663 RepID=A0A218X2N6_PUNGR|nr:hypothetical protein CDL15_Pgr003365 [Punica granatum]